MSSFQNDGAGGLRGPRAASGSPVSDRRTRARWRARVHVIDRHRILAGFSQRKLARAARVDPATLSDLLCGKRRPNLGTLAALATALGITLGELIEFEDEDKP